MTSHNLADNTKARFLAKLENGSEEWLDVRNRGIGGSEVGTIVGVNPWESPYTLWAKKTGRIERSIPANEAMEWGNRLEPVVIDKFADEHPELTVLRNVGTWSHSDREWQIANPDAIFVTPAGDFGIIEVKTAQYEDGWSEGVPAHYEAQVQWYLQTFGFDRAYVIVLFHGNRYSEFEILADALYQERALKLVTEFREYVVGEIAPEFDGARNTYETVRKVHPKIEDTETEIGWLGVEYFAADEAYRAAEAEVLKTKSLILDAMGFSKRGLVDGEWVFSRSARGTGDPFLVVKRG
jgi:putative phage-type endonuclease